MSHHINIEKVLTCLTSKVLKISVCIVNILLSILQYLTDQLTKCQKILISFGEETSPFQPEGRHPPFEHALRRTTTSTENISTQTSDVGPLSTIQKNWLDPETVQQLAYGLDAKGISEFRWANPQYCTQINWLDRLRFKKIRDFAKTMPERLTLQTSLDPDDLMIELERSAMGEWCFPTYTTAEIPESYTTFVQTYGYQIRLIGLDFNLCIIGDSRTRTNALRPFLFGLNRCRTVSCCHPDLENWTDVEKRNVAKNLEIIVLESGCLNVSKIEVQGYFWTVNWSHRFDGR